MLHLLNMMHVLDNLIKMYDLKRFLDYVRLCSCV